MRKAITLEEKEKVLVLRRKNKVSLPKPALTSQDKVKVRDQSSKQGTNHLLLCSHQCCEGTILVPQEFLEETTTTKKNKTAPPTPPSTLVIHMILEHKREAWV